MDELYCISWNGFAFTKGRSYDIKNGKVISEYGYTERVELLMRLTSSKFEIRTKTKYYPYKLKLP